MNNYKATRMKKTLTLIALIGIISVNIQSQQDAMYTHYMFNTLSVNPGYAGSRDAITMTGLHRSQWVGFEGAPITQTLTIHAPTMKDRVGLGLSFVNDKIGPTNTTSFYADFAYRIKVNNNGKLSLGLKGGANLLQASLRELNVGDDEYDVVFSDNLRSQWLPNFGFGAYYSEEKWYAGISVPRLLENDFRSNSTSGTATGGSEQRHYFLITGAVFDLTKSIQLKPTSFVKLTIGAPIEADFTGTLIFREKFNLGAMFRTGDALGLILGYSITDQFYFGYSYDFSYTNTTFKYNGGSHELTLRYDFIFKDKSGIHSPRYF